MIIEIDENIRDDFNKIVFFRDNREELARKLGNSAGAVMLLDMKLNEMRIRFMERLEASIQKPNSIPALTK